MKKLIFGFAAAFLFLTCTSCFGTKNFNTAENYNDNTLAVPEQSGAVSSVPETSNTYNTIDEGDKAKLDALEADAVKAMQLSQDVYAAADKGTSVNVTLSKETVNEIVSAIGAGGYSVIDYDGNLNMQNPEAMMALGEAVNAGRDAEASYFTVQSDGRISENVISFVSGSGTEIAMSLEWNEKMEPIVYDAGQYALSDIKYTDKGWLIFNRDITNFHINKKFNVDSHTLVRISPYDETSRKLCQKYIEPVGYSENNLFTSTWSESDYGALDFNCLFPILYGAYYDIDSLTFYSANEKFDLISGTNMQLIPKDDFERVIDNFFDINSNELRNLADYSESQEGYFMLGYQTGYYDVAPRLPTPEVVDYWYNADGTLTLKVDAIFPWYGTDRAFTHELTIRIIGGGFQYVSNYLYENEGNILPDCKLAPEREREINGIE
ncbi:MAG: DUF6070 family protein [Oscillospiraceae bacterium]